jgi:hypothetical protein
MVAKKSTPSGVPEGALLSDFTKRCNRPYSRGMKKDLAAIRRANLQRLVERDFGKNISALSRTIDPEASSSFLGEVLRATRPSFGEKLAAKIEDRVGLIEGQPSVEDSPLKMQVRQEDLDKTIIEGLKLLNRLEKRELIAAIAQIRRRNSSAT